MRYMMMVKANKDYEAGVPPKKELMEAIAKHGAELAKAGILLDTGGLMPSAKGARILASGGNLNVIDGPFAEAKELIGGFGILKADSKEEAIRLGTEIPFTIETPLMRLTKADTWALAERLGGEAFVDLVIEETHTCYRGARTERHSWGYGCGTCPACELRARGFAEWQASRQVRLASR